MKAANSDVGNSSQQTPLNETQQIPVFTKEQEDNSAPSRITEMTQPNNQRINSHGFAQTQKAGTFANSFASVDANSTMHMHGGT